MDIQPGIHLFLGFRGTGLEEELKHLITEYHPAGIVLFKRNITGPGQLRELLADAQAFAGEQMNRPLLVAIDQEGGTVQRLTPHFTSLPSAKDLAEEGPEAVIRWVRICAADLNEIGVHINFAPVLDIVPRGLDHFMESRSLGAVPGSVADLGRTWIETLQANRISATAKHFPGLGRAELDPHHFSPLIQGDSLEEFRRHLIPFQAAIKAGVNCVMTSHAVYPSVDPGRPATLSPEINRTWLRERLGFGGLLFSDDLDMAAISENYAPGTIVREGLACSTDFFLLCQKRESIEPFFSNLSAMLDKDPQLQQYHVETIQRFEMLLRFHFGK